MAKKLSKAISKKKKELLLKLENIIGNSCYNGNIQNYYMWELEDEGRWFRYPITFIEKDGSKDKSRYPDSKISVEKLKSGHYAFGANQLFIFKALIEVLQYLENKYGLEIDTKPKANKQVERTR